MIILIDGQEVKASSGETILSAARRAGIHIPTLCYHENFAGQGRCRLCLVEVEYQGVKRIVTSCTYPITAQIKVRTSSLRIEQMRKNIVMLLYKQAPASSLLQSMYCEYGCQENLLQDNPGEKCILCNLCVLACEEMGSSAISLIMRGTDKKVATPYDEAAQTCLGCAACAAICPTQAIEVMERDGVRIIWNKEFKLLNCKHCGQPFATEEQINFVDSKGNYSDMLHYCQNCRQKMAARRIKDFR